jgi:hypothetical protein
LADANDVLAPADPVRAEVLAATDALDDAVTGLTRRGNTAAVAAAAEAVAALAASAAQYTADSWGDLTAAIVLADGLLGGDLAEVTETQADVVLAAIADALAGLVPVVHAEALTALADALHDAIDGAGLDAQDYTEASYQALVDALAEADEALAASPPATQTEIDQALADLAAAVGGLTRSSRLAALSAVVLLAETLAPTAQDYTAGSWAAYILALAEANATLALGPEGAGQARVDAATAGLRAAIVGLTSPAGKEALRELIAAVATLA